MVSELAKTSITDVSAQIVGTNIKFNDIGSLIKFN